MFDLLFPSYCINCGKPGEYLCSICQKKLKRSLPECYICRRISPSYKTHKRCIPNYIDAVFIGWQYDEISKKLLSQFKYRYAYKLSEIISDLLLKRLEETGFQRSISKNTILVPIPSHISHFKQRGFNQTELIAKKLSQSLDIRIYENFMIRDADSRYQSKLSAKERLDLKSVFKIKKNLKGEDIILIDDVITTGTTLNRAAKTLMGNNIKAIALFRGRQHYH